MVRVKKLILGILILSSFSVVIFAKESTYENDTINGYENTNSAVYNSNRFTQKDPKSEFKQNSLVNLVGYEFVCESNQLKLYMNKSNLSIRIENKANGYIWGSSFTTENERLNKIWKSRVESAIWITYFRKTEVRDESIEESITTSGNSKVTTEILENGFKSKIIFGQSQIEMELKVTLSKDNLLSVEIPFDSIKDTENRMLGYIKVYPFMGAIKTLSDFKEMEGYTLIPDGSGALIRYNKQDSIALPVYSKQIFSRDIALYDTSLDEFTNQGNQINLPIYGMVHGINQNAYYAHSKSGSEYARIVSYEAGRTTDFYWTYFEYMYRIQYQKPISKTQSVVATQKVANHFDLKLDYRFLEKDEANYVGIANDYKAKMIKEDIVKNNIAENRTDIPIRLEFLMSETKKGLIFRDKVVVTTTDQLIEILEKVKSKGIYNIELVLKGWSKQGYYGTSPSYFGFDSGSGKKSGYKELIDYCEKQNINVYFNADYTKYYDGAGTASKMTDLARNIKGNSINGVIEQYNYYYINPNKTYEIFKNDFKTYEKYQMNNIAYEEVGSNLYSSWTNKPVSSSDAISIYNNLLKMNPNLNALYGINEYMLLYANRNFETPFYSSGYALFTDTVPFVSLATAKLVENYSMFINNFSNIKDEVLRLIDYNIYPSFNLTHDSSKKLYNTPSKYLSSTQFSVWESSIFDQYDYINNALKHFIHANLIHREVLESGVVKNTYDNHKELYINYLNQDIISDGITLKANSYLVKEVD